MIHPIHSPMYLASKAPAASFSLACMTRMLLGLTAVAALAVPNALRADDVPEGFRSLFNGEDFSGWTVPEGDDGGWQVIDGVIDYRALSKAPGDKNLWSEEEFGDFELRIDWRITETPTIDSVPMLLPDGSEKVDEEGNRVTVEVPNADSGIYLRGTSKAQVNIWNWPIGSGEVWGYRTDGNQPAEVRAAVTPKVRADREIGEWNTFVITMKGDRLTVVLNDRTVIENAQLPGVPEKGRLALQHHGGQDARGNYRPASSLVQFRNIYIKEL